MSARLLIAAMLLASLTIKASADAQQPETVEADVSTRSVAIDAGFNGAEIVVFGAVENSRQTSPEAGVYDVVITIEGEPEPLIVRQKQRRFGVIVNASQMRVASLPKYYAIASTRPIYDIAEAPTLAKLELGFEHMRIVPAPAARVAQIDGGELNAFRNAIIRLKQRAQLFSRSDYGVSFVGRSLFRATMPVPPNVPVGDMKARVFLFRDGVLLGKFQSTVRLARTGIERFLYDAAFGSPVLYGMATVALAALAGLLSALALRREA